MVPTVAIPVLPISNLLQHHEVASHVGRSTKNLGNSLMTNECYDTLKNYLITSRANSKTETIETALFYFTLTEERLFRNSACNGQLFN